MSQTRWTASQRAAIQTRGSSLLVSAGAGSGKTSVLAERCAHLVADPAAGCSVDRLLVVTFTDAAATQMRERVGAAIAKRLERDPDNAWLQRQSVLLDGALICTLHSFCRRTLDRFFAHARIDPGMPLLDAADARLLRRQTVRSVFDAFSARSDASGEAFHNLIAAYGAGREDPVIDRVLELDAFLSSIPDPEQWLAASATRFAAGASDELSPEWRTLLGDRLRNELRDQLVFVEQQADTLRQQGESAEPFVTCLDAYAAMLAGWLEMLGPAISAEVLDRLALTELSKPFPPIPARRGKAYTDLSKAHRAVFEARQEQCEEIREKLFRRRLFEPFARFRMADWAAGIARTRPHVETLISIAQAVRSAYAHAKRELGVLDFGDLERFTLDLLRDDTNNVAKRMREQFEQVLVDEFQDINPVQAEILRLVSRESVAHQTGNLFTVGDVKQSIYRFRLAEPRLFQERHRAFAPLQAGDAGNASPGRAIDLVENFRSRRAVIDAINAIFERLMTTDLAGMAYDDRARLKYGREETSDPIASLLADGPGVELHILNDEAAPRTIDAMDPDSDEEADEDEDDPDPAATGADDWERIEREAYVIADRIRALVATGVRYGDIVILLRSLAGRAPLLVRTLSRLGIPVYTDAPGGLLAATEVRDVLALLAIVDNAQQDIPLAAVLRSPVLGEPIGDSDLVAIRTSDGTSQRGDSDPPFAVAVQRYIHRGRDAALRARLVSIFSRVDRWRDRARQHPIAEVLWEMYEESGYLAFVEGLPDGRRRRANLLALHELARTFSTYGRHGLASFLRFVEGLRDAEDDLAPGMVPPADGSAVRIMSIHKSKGLEFPVVIVAELGKRFNLRDTAGAIQFDRALGIGLRAVDVEQRITYPTLPHRLVSRQARTECLAEEMRVLYVALTRARERLILVGTMPLKALDPLRSRYAEWAGPLPRTALYGAGCLLDWLVPALCAQDPADVDHLDGSQGPTPATPRNVGARAPACDSLFGSSSGPLFEIRTYSADSMKGWSIDPPPREDVTARLRAFADMQPIELAPAGDSVRRVVEMIERRLTTPYRAAALTRTPAVAAASELKRHWHAAEEEARGPWPVESPSGAAIRLRHFPRPAFAIAGDEDDATLRGTLTHQFLERLDLSASCDLPDLTTQLQRLCDAGLSRPADGLSTEDIAWFFQTDLGRRLRKGSTRILREWPFVIGVDPRRYDPAAVPHDERDVLLVRGVIDCLFDDGDGWEVLDYKTDRVSGAALDERVDLYRGQLAIYSEAVQTAWQHPPRRRWLVFLTARTIVEV